MHYNYIVPINFPKNLPLPMEGYGPPFNKSFLEPSQPDQPKTGPIFSLPFSRIYGRQQQRLTKRPTERSRHKGKGKEAYSSLCYKHHTATETHVRYGITQCYLPSGRVHIPVFTPSQLRLELDLVAPEGYKAELT